MTSRQGNKADIEARFGYAENGRFRCAYGNEKPLLIITAAVTAAVAAAVFGAVAALVTDVTAVFFYAMTLVLSESVVFFVGATVAKLILYGKECWYHADEQKLSVEREGRHEDFFYMNVQAVRYEPLVTLGKQRGFRISVRTNKTTVVYKYIFGRTDVVMSPEKTPFAIIEERAGLRTEGHSFASPAVTAFSQPSVIAEQHIAERASQESDPQGGSDILGRTASPDTKITRVASEAEELTAKGTFRVPFKYEFWLFLALFILSVAAFADGLADFARAEGAMADLAPIAVLAVILLSVGAFRVFHRTEYSYNADSREFRIRDKKGRETVIYFCDVVRVEYKPFKLLWIQRGYIVNIVMKYTTVIYKYLFPYRRKSQKTEDTPFHHIERMVSGEHGKLSWKRGE